MLILLQIYRYHIWRDTWVFKASLNKNFSRNFGFGSASWRRTQIFVKTYDPVDLITVPSQIQYSQPTKTIADRSDLSINHSRINLSNE